MPQDAATLKSARYEGELEEMRTGLAAQQAACQAAEAAQVGWASGNDVGCGSLLAADFWRGAHSEMKAMLRASAPPCLLAPAICRWLRPPRWSAVRGGWSTCVQNWRHARRPRRRGCVLGLACGLAGGLWLRLHWSIGAGALMHGSSCFVLYCAPILPL